MACRSNCTNPFKKPRHAVSKKSLRPVIKKMCMIDPGLGLTIGTKICDSCRKQLGKTPCQDECYSESSKLDITMAWRSNCTNPFKKPRHAVSKKSLRPVTKKMCMIDPGLGLTIGTKICDSCRKQLGKTPCQDECYSESSN